MTVERQIVEIPENQISTKRGFPVYPRIRVCRRRITFQRGRSVFLTCRVVKGLSSWIGRRWKMRRDSDTSRKYDREIQSCFTTLLGA